MRCLTPALALEAAASLEEVRAPPQMAQVITPSPACSSDLLVSMRVRQLLGSAAMPMALSPAMARPLPLTSLSPRPEGLPERSSILVEATPWRERPEDFVQYIT